MSDYDQVIEVLPSDQTIVVDPATQTVQVIRSGPQGPPGAAGGDAAHYEHTQAIAASSWVINHNLGFFPNVHATETSSGRNLNGAVIQHSTTQLELQFNTPRAGTAWLS